MGLAVEVAATPPPAWAAVLGELRAAGLAPVVVMVDNLPAFPGEQPGEECAEVRVGFPPGMVTLRRTPAGVACLVWGNADAALVAARDACADAVRRAAAGN